jgi:hypothetical protein
MTPHKDSCLDPWPPAPTPMLPESSVLAEALQVCHPHAAGIDIGEAEHWVAVPPRGTVPNPCAVSARSPPTSTFLPTGSLPVA